MSAPVIQFDPVFFSIGPVEVRWYGLMYVIGFVVGGQLLKYLCRTGFFKVEEKDSETFVTYLIVGMFIGARLAYVFIYNWDYYSNHFDEMLMVWKGGLSFHGALAGMCLSTFLFARKHKLHFFEVSDCLAVAGTQGLFFGRMGNFINGELFGRRTDSFFGMIFPNGGPFPRHPSQLYEGFIEGLFLWALFFFLHKRVKNYGIISSLFLIGYGIGRYIVEFFREPDSQLGYYFGGTTTMGQILCLIMVAIGLVMLFFTTKKIKLPVKRA